MSYLNTDFDQKLNTIQGLTWLPWIGKDFHNQQERLLIVGESHYSDGDSLDAFNKNIALAEDKYFTRNMIEQTQIKKLYEHKALSNLFSALYGKNTMNEKDVWSKISFYNFVQRSMNYSNIHDQKKTEQPTIKDFDFGWEIFVQMVKIIKPTKCIFIGVRAAEPFERMMDKLKIQRTDRIVHPEINKLSPRTASVTIDGNTINLTFIKHTSAYFSPQAWGGFLKERI